MVCLRALYLAISLLPYSSWIYSLETWYRSPCFRPRVVKSTLYVIKAANFLHLIKQKRYCCLEPMMPSKSVPIWWTMHLTQHQLRMDNDLELNAQIQSVVSQFYLLSPETGNQGETISFKTSLWYFNPCTRLDYCNALYLGHCFLDFRWLKIVTTTPKTFITNHEYINLIDQNPFYNNVMAY